jgi:hypothetical protein
MRYDETAAAQLSDQVVLYQVFGPQWRAHQEKLRGVPDVNLYFNIDVHNVTETGQVAHKFEWHGHHWYLYVMRVGEYLGIFVYNEKIRDTGLLDEEIRAQTILVAINSDPAKNETWHFTKTWKDVKAWGFQKMKIMDALNTDNGWVDDEGLLNLNFRMGLKRKYKSSLDSSLFNPIVETHHMLINEILGRYDVQMESQTHGLNAKVVELTNKCRETERRLETEQQKNGQIIADLKRQLSLKLLTPYGVVPPPPLPETKQENGELQQQLETLKSDKTKLEQQLQQYTSLNNQYMQQFEYEKKRREELEQKLEKYKKKKKDLLQT